MRLADKKIFLITGMVLSLALIFILKINVNAADYDNAEKKRDYNEETGYEAVIMDGADLLSDAEENQLMERMMQVTEYGNAYFVTTANPNPSTSKTAESIYRPLHGGTPGGLYIIDMANRELYLYIDDSGYMGKTLTVAYCNTIADNTYTFAKNKQYFRCADETFNQMYIILDGGRIAQPMKHISNVLASLVLALLIVLRRRLRII